MSTKGVKNPQNPVNVDYGCPLVILLWSTVIENQCINSAVVAILFLIYIGPNYIQEYILPIGFIKLWSEWNCCV